MVFTSEYSFKPFSPLKEEIETFCLNSNADSNIELQCTHCWRPLEQEYFLLDRDLHHVKLFWKVGFQNTKSAILVLQTNLCVFSRQTTKSYSHFTSIARHFISSKWTLCAQSVEAVYPVKYTKHWSLLISWLAVYYKNFAQLYPKRHLWRRM